MSQNVYFQPSRLDPSDPGEVVTQCIEAGERALVLDRAALPPDFFDLSTGVLGALAHRLSLYGIRMAAVVPDSDSHPLPFQDFVREAHRGDRFRFTAPLADARDWLAAAAADLGQPG